MIRARALEYSRVAAATVGLLRFVGNNLGQRRLVQTVAVALVARVAHLVAFLAAIKLLVGLVTGGLDDKLKVVGLDASSADVWFSVLIPVMFFAAGGVRLLSDRMRAEVVVDSEYGFRRWNLDAARQEGPEAVRSAIVGSDVELRKASKEMVASAIEIVEIGLFMTVLCGVLLWANLAVGIVVIGLGMGLFAAWGPAARRKAAIGKEFEDRRSERYSREKVKMLEERANGDKIDEASVDEFISWEYNGEFRGAEVGKRTLGRAMTPVIYGFLGIVIAILFLIYDNMDVTQDDVPVIVILLFVLRFMAGLVQNATVSVQRLLKHRPLLQSIVERGSVG